MTIYFSYLVFLFSLSLFFSFLPSSLRLAGCDLFKKKGKMGEYISSFRAILLTILLSQVTLSALQIS